MNEVNRECYCIGDEFMARGDSEFSINLSGELYCRAVIEEDGDVFDFFCEVKEKRCQNYEYMFGYRLIILCSIFGSINVIRDYIIEQTLTTKAVPKEGGLGSEHTLLFFFIVNISSRYIIHVNMAL